MGATNIFVLTGEGTLGSCFFFPHSLKSCNQSDQHSCWSKIYALIHNYKYIFVVYYEPIEDDSNPLRLSLMSCHGHLILGGDFLVYCSPLRRWHKVTPDLFKSHLHHSKPGLPADLDEATNTITGIPII